MARVRVLESDHTSLYFVDHEGVVAFYTENVHHYHIYTRTSRPSHRDGQTTTPVSMLKPFLLFGIAIVDDKEKVCE